VRVNEFIEGLDEREPSDDERLEERLLSYGFSHEEIEKCLSEVAAYAAEGRRS
jgi:uncharacterized protein Smg (DUF494 family)